MLRRMAAAVAVLAVLGGFVLAETIRGSITKMEDKSIEVSTRVKKGEKPEKKTIKISKDTKFTVKKGKDDDGKETTAADVKKMLGKAKRGVFATIETKDDVATEVTIIQFAGKGKGKKKKDD